MKIIVPALPLRVIPGKKDPSKKWQFQTVDVYLSDAHGNNLRHPVEHEIISEAGDEVYPAGEYSIAATSFYKDQKSGRLAFSLRLAPVKKATA